MNDSDCGVTGQFKYTFDNFLCIRVAWKGCQSQNLFDDEETCANSCHPQASDFKNQLEELPEQDVEAINSILDNVIVEQQTSRVPIQQLKLQIPYKEPEEMTTEPKTTSAETVTEYVATSSKAVETTTEKVETSTKLEETTIEAEETTSTTMETTVALTEADTTISTTAETTTTTVASTTTTITTTEGSGDADEVVLT